MAQKWKYFLMGAGASLGILWGGAMLFAFGFYVPDVLGL